MATAAVFIALGGSAYAAAKITGRDVVDGSLSGADVRDASLGGVDVRDGSLRARDFRRGERPRGAGGPAGPQGATGSPGPAGPAGIARAFGLINEDGTVVPGAKGIVAVHRVSAGLGGVSYCIRFAFTAAAAVGALGVADAPGTIQARDVSSRCDQGEWAISILLPNGLLGVGSFTVMAN